MGMHAASICIFYTEGKWEFSFSLCCVIVLGVRLQVGTMSAQLYSVPGIWGELIKHSSTLSESLGMTH